MKLQYYLTLVLLFSQAANIQAKAPIKSQQPNKSLSAGQKAGIVLGCLGATAIGVAGIFCWFVFIKKQEQSKYNSSHVGYYDAKQNATPSAKPPLPAKPVVFSIAQPTDKYENLKITRFYIIHPATDTSAYATMYFKEDGQTRYMTTKDSKDLQIKLPGNHNQAIEDSRSANKPVVVFCDSQSAAINIVNYEAYYDSQKPWDQSVIDAIASQAIKAANFAPTVVMDNSPFNDTAHVINDKPNENEKVNE